MIDRRIKIETDPGEFNDVDAYQDAQQSEILSKAAMIAAELGVSTVRLEVEYRDPNTGEYPDWAVSGDALEISFKDAKPQVETLPPYEVMAP